MMSQFWQFLIKRQNGVMYTLMAFVLVVFTSMTVWGEGGLKELNRLEARRDVLSAQNVQQLEYNLKIKREILKLKASPEYVENTVRNKLGMVREDETVYLIR